MRGAGRRCELAFVALVLTLAACSGAMDVGSESATSLTRTSSGCGYWGTTVDGRYYRADGAPPLDVREVAVPGRLRIDSATTATFTADDFTLRLHGGEGVAFTSDCPGDSP